MIVINHNKSMSLYVVKNALLVFILLLCSSIASAQSCDSELTVEKNRSFKSVAANGQPTYFVLNLKNTGTSAKEFEIVISQLDTPCDNGTNRTAAQNTSIQYNITSANNTSLSGNTIVVQGGKTEKFKVKVSATVQTTINMWGCLKVSAQLDDCSSTSHVVLSSFIPDPKAN